MGSSAEIDDPIVKYLPELAGRPGLDRIHIRHLLAMASGLRYRRVRRRRRAIQRRRARLLRPGPARAGA